MVISSCGGGFGCGSGSCSGVKFIDERIQALVMSEIARGNLEETTVIFGTIKEGIMELMDDRLGEFLVEIAAGRVGAQTLFFKEFKRADP